MSGETKDLEAVPLPTLVRDMMKNGACLTGSCVNFMFGEGKPPHDIDLIVPPEDWYAVRSLIPSSYVLNKFGGIRFEAEGWVVDARRGDLQQYLKQAKSRSGNPVYVMRLVKKEVR